jgi:hypothetical protein
MLKDKLPPENNLFENIYLTRQELAGFRKFESGESSVRPDWIGKWNRTRRCSPRCGSQVYQNRTISTARRIAINVDLGFEGVKKDYQTKKTNIPHEKPRKSKKNPNTG